MEAVYYNFEEGQYSKFHFIRFYEDGQVLALTYGTDKIPDVSAFLGKNLDFRGFDIIGEKEYVFMGAYDEGATKINFKVQNEVSNSHDKYADQDMLSGKCVIISEDELQVEITSKLRKTTVSRSYRKVMGNVLP
jgi:hypothetical protein